jgi:hypothetical protein
MLVALAAAPARAQDCGNDSVGVRPLDDLSHHKYGDFWGGLYPDCRNVMPDRHRQDGITIAKTIVPLDAQGNPSPTGKIGVASIGFSFTRLAFLGFEVLAAQDVEIDPAIAPVNAAAPAQFADDLADPGSPYWRYAVPLLLDDAGVDARQVQVVWLQSGFDEQTLPFPDHVYALEDLFVEILHAVKIHFPNAKLCYLASLHYLGYSAVPVASEPYYFEQGFAQKRVVQRQIEDDPLLEFDPATGPVVAPWVAWGPYFWTDGAVPRSDGFDWTCADVQPDGVHPSFTGRLRLGAQLLHFWKSDPTATPWFLADGVAVAGVPADVELVGDGTIGALGEPLISVSNLPTLPADAIDLQATHAAPKGSGLFLLGYSSPFPDGQPFAGGRIYVDVDLTLPVAFDASGSGRLALGELPDDPALAGFTAYAQLVSFDPMAIGGAALSSAIEIVLGD